MCYVDKLCSVLSYYAVGHKLNVNESARCVTQGVFQQKHTDKILYSSVDKSVNRVFGGT